VTDSFYMLKVAPKSAEKLHRMLLETAMRQVSTENNQEYLLTSHSATLGFLSSTDSGLLLNRLVKTPKLSMMCSHYPTTDRFSQDMSIINQALPMVMLNFSIGKAVIFCPDISTR
jgi:hypothetical protein